MAPPTATSQDPSAPVSASAGAGGREPPQPLPTGTRLRDYEVQGVVSAGPYGFVYRAFDHALQRSVAIKEFVPHSMASRATGTAVVVVASEAHFDAYRAALRSFVDEARLLARFEHPSLVKVYRFWEENGTAYRAMPFHEGPTLRTALAALGRVPGEAELRAWLRPILDAVAVMHEGKVWHEHIAPGNILLTASGPVLLGTAAPRRTLAALTHVPAAAFEAGYAAIEQYGHTSPAGSGPWTDLYALAAIVHGAITSEPPQPANERLRSDRLKPLSQVAAGLYSSPFLAAIDAALSLQPERRPQDHVSFRALMGDIAAPERLELAPRRDLMHEPFIGGAAGDEITVPDWPAAAPPRPTPSRPAPLTLLSRPATLDGGDRTDSRRAASPTNARRPPAATDDRRDRRRLAVYAVSALGAIAVAVAVVMLAPWSRSDPGERATSTTPSLLPATRSVVAAPIPQKPTVAPVTATPAVAPASASVAVAPGATVNVNTRCLEILQKASLEPITTAETDFFRKECR